MTNGSKKLLTDFGVKSRGGVAQLAVARLCSLFGLDHPSPTLFFWPPNLTFALFAVIDAGGPNPPSPAFGEAFPYRSGKRGWVAAPNAATPTNYLQSYIQERHRSLGLRRARVGDLRRDRFRFLFSGRLVHLWANKTPRPSTFS